MVITTAICHSRSVELSVWLSNSGVDDDTRFKYLHGFLEMVRATSEIIFRVRRLRRTFFPLTTPIGHKVASQSSILPRL